MPDSTRETPGRRRGLAGLFWQNSDRYFQLPKTYAEAPSPAAKYEHPLGRTVDRLDRWWIRLSSGDRHPTARFYWTVGIILSVITALELWAYNWPFARVLVNPILLALSAVKFVMVVGFFMHLRFDHPLFRALFGFGLILAIAISLSLLLLFFKLNG
jgi:cytochrome c oxidase subunit 4